MASKSNTTTSVVETSEETIITTETVEEETYEFVDDEIVPPEPRADGQHPLRFAWTLWFVHRQPGQKITDYEAAIKKIDNFSTIEEFWTVYSHLRRPNDLSNVSDFHLFKKDVRPVWEDPVNAQGGKWMVRLKKGIASRLWEQLVIAIITEQFDVGREICGAVLSMRHSEDILSLWNRTASDSRLNLRIRDTLKRLLGLPAETVMEYKTHNDSLKDNSSFRNTDVYK
jgi:translation initiation factor 4E